VVTNSIPILRIALWAPRIPQNTGQIARTCFAMGMELHLIRPLGFRTDAASLRRAGVGYWEEVNPVIHTDLDVFWNAVDDPARVFLFSKHAPRSFRDARFRRGDYLLFGNEDEGLPSDCLAAHADRALVIPMKNPAARCLNLAAAVTAASFEALRQIEFRIS
jgi:tRNA (cytidine/uridine-2'-O-)-methyltransferase